MGRRSLLAHLVGRGHCHGNNLFWYLTYRDDRNAAGGFACPKTVAALLERGVDPNRRNNLGLSWNDVARHVVRSEVFPASC